VLITAFLERLLIPVVQRYEGILRRAEIRFTSLRLSRPALFVTARAGRGGELVGLKLGLNWLCFLVLAGVVFLS